jgi:hypothetical protein
MDQNKICIGICIFGLWKNMRFARFGTFRARR